MNDEWEREFADELEDERMRLHGPEPVETPDWCGACGTWHNYTTQCPEEDDEEERNARRIAEHERRQVAEMEGEVW